MTFFRPVAAEHRVDPGELNRDVNRHLKREVFALGARHGSLVEITPVVDDVRTFPPGGPSEISAFLGSAAGRL